MENVLNNAPGYLTNNIIWVASNLSKDSKELNHFEIQGLVNIFYNTIQNNGVLFDVAQGLAALSKVGDESNLYVVAGLKQPQPDFLIYKMSELLSSPNESLFSVSLDYIGSILVSENDTIMDMILNNDIFEKLMDNMHLFSSKIVKNCLWIISNITASNSGTKYQ